MGGGGGGGGGGVLTYRRPELVEKWQDMQLHSIIDSYQAKRKAAYPNNSEKMGDRKKIKEKIGGEERIEPEPAFKLRIFHLIIWRWVL